MKRPQNIRMPARMFLELFLELIELDTCLKNIIISFSLAILVFMSRYIIE